MVLTSDMRNETGPSHESELVEREVNAGLGELVRQILNADDGSVRKLEADLCRLVLERVKNFSLWKYPSAPEKDVASRTFEIFLRLLRDGEFEFRSEEETASYIRGIAENVAQDFINSARKEGSIGTLDDEEVIPDQNDIDLEYTKEELKIITEELRKKVREFIELWASDKRAEVLILHLNGHHHTEISDRLGISRSAARQRYYRGIDDMKKFLLDIGYEEDRIGNLMMHM